MFDQDSPGLKISLLSIPRLLETGHFGGCRDRDKARLSKSCRDRDFFESLADPWSDLIFYIGSDKNMQNLDWRKRTAGQIFKTDCDLVQYLIFGTEQEV